jgi:hypothetical protein
MRIELCNGKQLYFPAATQYSQDDKYLYVEGKRKHEIARVQLCFVAAWWYDTEEVEVNA